MITFKDLRIGNYLFDPFKKVVRVCDIGIDHIGVDLFHGGTFESFSPIPLTHEWLLKFGFEYRNEGQYSNKIKGGYYYGTIPPSHLFQIKNPSYKGGNYRVKSVHFGLSFCYIEYVHQLQNIYFALTEKELHPVTEPVGTELLKP